MNRIFKYISFLALLSFLFIACEDNRLDGMADDKIYLIKSGIQPAQLYNFGSYDYELPVYKSGYGTKKASIELTVDPALLTSYNSGNGTSYQLLPASCYSLKTNTINMNEEAASEKYTVAFNTSEILKLQGNGNSYILPLLVKSLNGIALDSAKSRVLLMPNVAEPYLSFSSPGMASSATSIAINDPDEISLQTGVQTNYKNLWDLTFSLEYSSQTLADYNAANGTSYVALPENAYRFDTKPWSMASGTSTANIPYTIVKKNLVNSAGSYLFGEYVLPLKIKSVSKYGIDPDNGVQFIRFSYLPDLLDRSSWAVTEWNSCISQEEWYTWLNRTPEKILDGDEGTFWGSKWDYPSPLPYYFIIDMQAAKTVFRVGITKPADSWRGNMKKGYFEISNDQQTWTKLGDWEAESNDPRSHVFDVTPAKGRYLKFVITEAFWYANWEVGPASGAQMDLSELYVWGVNE